MLVVKHIPAHVGIEGNEHADKLAKAATRTAHQVAARTSADRARIALDSMADTMVSAMTTDFQQRELEEPASHNDPLQWKWVPFHLRI